MIKVLIVDDEPLILIGIQSMLQWNLLGYTVVDTARNGAQALELIEKHQPDIVISDIKMPVMDGLELAERCHKKSSLPIFIVLTSYEEVDLIRRSLSSGVVEYLIKMELTPESLQRALERAAGQVRKENALLDTRRDLRVFQNRFFSDLLTGQLTPPQIEQQRQALDLALDGPVFQLALCNFKAEVEDADRLRTLCGGVYDMTGTLLSAETSCFSFVRDMHCFGLLFSWPAPVAEDALRDRLLHTSEVIFKYFNVRLLWAVAQPVTSLTALPGEYRRVNGLLPFAAPDAPVLFYTSELPEVADRRACIIADIQEYIRQNLGTHLTLNEVAQVFSISPTYLSHLFSQYGDSGFVEYITEMRMERARQMLEKGDKMIYEISDELGFENAGYFSKVFKKIVGVSPRNYIRSQQ